MTITQNVASKLVVGFVVASMLFTLSFTPAKAQVTASALQTQITTLLAQIASLQGTTTAAPTGGACVASFMVNLKVGSTGADVKKLQAFLNRDVETRVAAAGAGSIGAETMTYGPMTAAAVSKFQIKYRAEILTPGGLVSPTGFFGPSSRAKANMLCSSVVPTVTTVIPRTTSTTTPVATSTALQGGAGDLEDVNVLSTYSGEDVLEGSDNTKVMAFELEADNGSDLGIQNVRVTFEMTGAGSSRMNKYMSDVSIFQGTTKVGSADVRDFSENGDVYSKSIALTNAVVKDGAKSKFVVAVDAVSNIDSADLGEDWTVILESVRFVDASGAIITDSSTGDLGDVGADDADFSFEDLTSSGDLELKATEGSNSPDARVVEVDDVSDTNDVLLLEVKLAAKGSDMTIDEMVFDVTPTGANANLIVKQYILVVDGEEIDSISATSIASTVTGQITFTDLEDQFEINKGSSVTVKLLADINDLEGVDFVAGDSIVASFTNTNFIASSVDDQEGDALDNPDRTGSVVGETQTFFDEGIIVKLIGTPTAVAQSGGAVPESDSGLFTIIFDVTAFGTDVHIDRTNPLVTGGSGESDLEVTGTGTLTSSITTSSGEQGPTGVNGFRVAEGTTERFVITTNVLATASGFFDVALGSLAYALTDADSTTYYTSDLNAFKTPQVNLTDR